MKHLLFLDTETYSPHDLKTCGTHKYAEDVEIIMWQYAIDSGTVIVEDNLSPELAKMLTDENYEIVIHNSHFDRTVIRHATGIDIPVSRIFDTMVCAMLHSLPGGLDKLCDIFGVQSDKAKSKEGSKLIGIFCKPQKKGDGHVYRNTKETHPKEWEAFRNYGRLDIEAMREVYNRMPKRNYKGFERSLWELDQRINDRGVCVDILLAETAIIATSKAKAKHDAFTLQKTGGEVASTNRRQALIDYVSTTFGISLTDLRAPSIRDKLKEDLPEEVQELLVTRLDASKTSSSKYKRVINCTSKDGRLRGLLQFYGASRTGRWAGRLFQPQNLPRPSIKGPTLDKEIEALKAGLPKISDASIMEICSSALRGVICAPPGRKLVVADLSNIEGRVLAWLAREQDKLNAFRDYDSGTGADLYNLTYAKAFGVPVETVTDDMRQIGKVMELAFGYEGGVGAWITFSTAFGIDLEKLSESAIDSIPEDYIRDSKSFLSWILEQKGNTYGLSERAFVMCNAFKQMWRDAHKNISAYWKGISAACLRAVENPGGTVIYGRHRIRSNGSILFISLPSGRCLCYISPKKEEKGWSYMGMNQYTHKWDRIPTYGGKIAENITQAVARDVLAYGMVVAEERGYEIVLTTHDEIISETPDTKNFASSELEAIMSLRGEWFEDMPLSAKGFETYRYRKG